MVLLRERDFKIALLLSVVIHIAAFMPGPLSRLLLSIVRRHSIMREETEVNYQAIIPPATRLMVEHHKVTAQEKRTFRKSVAADARAFAGSEAAGQKKGDTVSPKKDSGPDEPAVVKAEAYQDVPAGNAESRYAGEAVVPGEDLESIARYKEVVKAMVEREVNEKANSYYRNAVVGVRVEIMPGGNIRDLSLFRTSGKRSRISERIVLQSVRAAAPFPDFPEGLDKDTIVCKYLVKIKR